MTPAYYLDISDKNYEGPDDFSSPTKSVPDSAKSIKSPSSAMGSTKQDFEKNVKGKIQNEPNADNLAQLSKRSS
jgi:hypothetical protein